MGRHRQGTCRFTGYVDRFCEGRTAASSGRTRDIMPLPRPLFQDLGHWSPGIDKGLAHTVLAVTCGALTFLYDVDPDAPVPAKANSLHRAVFARLQTKLTHSFSELITEAQPNAIAGSFDGLASRSDAVRYPGLVADRVDSFETSGAIDPIPFLSDAV